MADYDVIGIGNAIVDVIFPATDEFLLTHTIAKSVMTLIDEFRAEQLIAAAHGASQSSGGSAANTMAGLASFGATGCFVGKVKNDRLGFSFAEDLQRIGVDYDTPMSVAGAPTACCVIAVTPDGHRSMSTYLGASRDLTPEDINAKQIGSASILYVEGYMWDDEKCKNAIRKAIAACKGAGNKVAFTLSDPFCVGRYREEFLHLMKEDIDILFANEEEAKALFEVDSFVPALEAVRDWRGLGIITRSEKGCVVADPSGQVHMQPAEPIAKVVDTTGAGDGFAAGFMYGMSRNHSLQACAQLGSIAAAEVISHYGARPEHSLKSLAAKAGL